MRLRAQKTRIFTEKKLCAPKCNDAYVCQQKIKPVFPFKWRCGKWFTSDATKTTRGDTNVRTANLDSPELITNCMNELAQEVGVMEPDDPRWVG